MAEDEVTGGIGSAAAAAAVLALAEEQAQEKKRAQAAEAAAADAAPQADGDGEMDELVELQLVEEARLEKLFEEQRAEKGPGDEVTLATFFKLFDMWIQLYRLNKCSEALKDIVPICREKGGQWKIQAIQALAFTLWKQSQFREAAKLFHEIEDDIGSSSALCENMGHTYSSLGDYEQAANYFRRSIQCMEHEEKLGKKVGDKAGVLLGLGLIEDRQGHFEKALATVRESQRLFRVRAGEKPSSLIAKAGMSIAKILLKLAALEKDSAKRIEMEEEAIRLEEENVQIFEVTCGDDSPLTASALRGLGEALLRRSRLSEAITALARAYLLEASKDAFDLLAVMEVHNLLFGVHIALTKMGKELDRPAFRSYKPTVEIALNRVRQMPQDANAGAYYKVAAEMLAFAEDYSYAGRLLGEALALFQLEDADKVEGLIATCQDLKDFCERQPTASASSTCKAGRASAKE